MNQGDVVCGLLFPPHQNAAVTVHPRMGAFHDPATRASPATALPFFFAARADMRGVAKTASGEANGVGVVALVAAEVLFTPSGWTRARHGNTGERGFDEFLVVDIGPGHGKADRHAASIGQDGPFDAQLAAIGGVFTGFFPRPAAPWSAPRRDIAIAKRCPVEHRNVEVPVSRACRTHRTASIPGSSDARCFPSRSSSAPLSSGIPYAARRRSHSLPVAD